MKQSKKYCMLTTKHPGLYRIKALRNVRDDVKVGCIGGLVSSDDNLSHDGTCWIYNDAKALQNSRVEDDAILTDSVMVTGKAIIREGAEVHDDAKILEYALIEGNSEVCNFSTADGSCKISGYSRLYGRCRVTGNAKIMGGVISDHALVKDKAMVSRGAKAAGECIVGGTTHLQHGALVDGKARLLSDSKIKTVVKYFVPNRVPITIDGEHINIGVEPYTLEEAMKDYKKICLSLQIPAEEYGALIKFIAKFYFGLKVR